VRHLRWAESAGELWSGTDPDVRRGDTESHTHCYSYGYCNGGGYGDCHGNGHCDSYSYAYGNGYTYGETDPDAQASAHVAA